MKKKITSLFVAVFLFAFQLSFAQVAWHSNNGTLPPSPSPKSGTAFYNQLTPASSGYMISQTFTDPASASYSSQAADDFEVPIGETWDITNIDIIGSYFAFTGTPINGLNINIYNDNSGRPGTVVYQQENVTTYNEVKISTDYDSYRYEITLPQLLTLTEGTYWISVHASSDMSVTERWGWQQVSGSIIGSEFHWRNPGDGFGTMITDWEAASMLLWSDLNLAFALYSAGQNNDMAVSAILSPTTGANLGTSEIVTIDVKNEGITTVNNFSITYTHNGGTPVTQMITGVNLGANQHMTIPFTTPVNLSTPGQHNISVALIMANDPRPENNTSEISVFNLVNVIPMVSSGSQNLTSCNFTFTDQGGLTGDLDPMSYATTTFHPTTPGDRIRLNFTDFNISGNQLIIYNGSSTSAPLINYYGGTDSPGVVEGLNPEGAITLAFEGFGTDVGPGWAAWVECITPYANEFEVSSFQVIPQVSLEGEQQKLTAVIRNLGSQTLSKEVTFRIDANLLTAIVSQPIAPLGTDTIEYTYNPTLLGEHNLTASIPSDNSPIANNSLSVNTNVLPWNTFFEDFEGVEFPPANWRHNGTWIKDESTQYSGLYGTTVFVPANTTDTLTSCRVNIDPNATLTFAARTNMWFPGSLEVYWFDENTGTKTLIGIPTLSSQSFQIVEMPLAGLSGIGRFGFVALVTNPYTAMGLITLDLIQGSNLTVYKNEHDLKVNQFIPSTLVSQFTPNNYDVVITNNGSLEASAGSYNVKFIINGPQPLEIATIPGETLAINESHTYSITHSIDSLLHSTIYAQIEYPAEQYPIDNKSSLKLISVVAPNSSINQTPTGEPINTTVPIDFTYQHNISQTLYFPNHIGNTGPLFGLAYHYTSAGNIPASNVTIWLGMTDNTELSEWLPYSTFTQVYNGPLNLIEGEQSIYIPFNTPFNYSDNTKQLAVMVKYDGAPSSKLAAYYSYPANGTFIAISLADNQNSFDPQNLPSYGYVSDLTPEIKFVFNDQTSTLSGLVASTDGTPLPNSILTINGLNLTTATNNSGQYEFLSVPAGTYYTNAASTGYFSNTIESTLTAGQPATLNFSLLPMATIAVEGRILGNDNPGVGLANATITLDGYSSYTTTSNADGSFIIDGVYTQNSYTLTVTAAGYQSAVLPVIVVNDPINLGDITLNEAMLHPYAAVAIESGANSVITWKTPNDAAYKTLKTDDGSAEDGFAAEPSEEVSLGNKFVFNEPTTITSIDLFFKAYTGTPQVLTVTIYDEAMNLIATTNAFTSITEEWINVEMPNRTFTGTHYIMVHWPGYSDQSTFLGFDNNVNTADNAYYYFPNSSVGVLSELTQQKGSFLIHLNALNDSKKESNTKSLTGYSITKGRIEDIDNVSSWPILNSALLSSTTYTDTDWSNSHTADWIYGIKTHYTTGTSEWVFSNPLTFLAVGIENTPDQSVSVHPNPATHYIVVENAQGKNYSLTTTDGKLLLSSQISNTKQAIDLSGVAPGSYLLILYDESSATTHKIIVR